MSAVVGTESPPNAPNVRRREWLLRGAFEATLILLGLLGAFALDEWQDARARAARVDALLTAVRAELEANLVEHEGRSTYNTETAEDIWGKATSGVTFIPDGTYRRGLFLPPQLTSAAWTTAQNDPALADVPVETVLLLAGTYEVQRKYAEDTAALLNAMYATVLQTDSAVLRIDGLGEPLRIGGVLRDFARRGARLVDIYRATLGQLGVELPAPEPSPAGPEPSSTAPEPSSAALEQL